MKRTEHAITQMQMGRGRCHFSGSTQTAVFTCPVCQRTRSFNLNWLGHGGQIFCNGLKTAVRFPSMADWSSSEYRSEKDLFKPTARQQLEKLVADHKAGLITDAEYCQAISTPQSKPNLK